MPNHERPTSSPRSSRVIRRSLRLLGDRSPRLDGTVHLDGPTATVTIRRDLHGVPHISASDDRDAWFGLGFVVGQDRTFQLEFYRRAVSGTMAAAVGRAGLDHDRLARRIGYRRAAERQCGSVDAGTRALLDAYAAGITSGQSVGRRRRSIEHAVLFLRPRPWDAVDILAFINVITASLSTNWDTELARLLILERDGADALAGVDAAYPAEHPVTSPAGTASGAIHRLRADLVQHQRWLPVAGGSNNWAIDGTRTDSGRPIVANDPHLTPQVPSQWYLAHVRTPDWAAAGATLVGAPGFIVGHNERVAWGATAGRADISDLVIETLSPDGSAVRRPEGWVDCSRHTEVIEVRGRRPVTEEVTVTDSGPIISPVIEGDPGCLSLRATWLEPGPLRGFFDAGRQSDVAGLVETFRHWNGPNINLIAGDVEGAIGWKYVASAPVRTGPTSRLPVHGHDPDHAWTTARVAFDELPGADGSAIGVLATANNQPVVGSDGSAGPDLGDEWADGYRVQRIHRILAGRCDWTPDAVAGVQLDQHVGLWDQIATLVVDRTCAEPDAELARQLLVGWDGMSSADSVPAAVFELMTHHLARRLMTDLAPSSTDLALGAPLHALSPFSGLAVRRSSWLAQRCTAPPPGFDLDAAIDGALHDATVALRGRGGASSAAWNWGRVRPLRIPHLLAELPLLGGALGLGPLETGGTANTVSMCASAPTDPLDPPVAMAGLRMVVEVGEWDAARFVLSGGQSGDPLSPHYDDQLHLWATGAAITIAWSSDAVDWATRHELQLIPNSAVDPPRR